VPQATLSGRVPLALAFRDDWLVASTAGYRRGMTEPADGLTEQDLTDDERQLLDRLRDVHPEDQDEALENRPEVERAMDDDTTMDPGLLTDDQGND
jgi:hypothetical protein